MCHLEQVGHGSCPEEVDNMSSRKQNKLYLMLFVLDITHHNFPRRLVLLRHY